MPDKIKDIWDVVSKTPETKDLFIDEGDFRDLLKKDKKGVYDLLSKNTTLFVDEADFDSFVGGDEPQKKNGIQPSPPQQNMQQLFQGRFGAGSPPSPSTSELGGSTLAQDISQLNVSLWASKPESKKILEESQKPKPQEPVAEAKTADDIMADQKFAAFPLLGQKVMSKPLQRDFKEYLNQNPEEAQKMQAWSKYSDQALREGNQFAVFNNFYEQRTSKIATRLQELDQQGVRQLMDEAFEATKNIDPIVDNIKKAKTKVDFYTNTLLEQKGYGEIVSNAKKLKGKINSYDKQPLENIISSIQDVEEKINQIAPDGQLAQENEEQYGVLRAEYEKLFSQYNEIINSESYNNYVKFVDEYNQITTEQSELIKELEGNKEYQKAKEDYNKQVASYEAIKPQIEQYKKYSKEFSEYRTLANALIDAKDNYDAVVRSAFPTVAGRKEIQKEADALEKADSWLSTAMKWGEVVQSLPKAFNSLAAGIGGVLSDIEDIIYKGDDKSLYSMGEKMADFYSGLNEFKTYVTPNVESIRKDNSINWSGMGFESMGQFGNMAVMATLGGSKAAIVGSGYLMSRHDREKEADEAGLKGLQKEAYVNALSLIEGMSELIMPDRQLLTKGIRDMILKDAVFAQTKGIKWFYGRVFATILENMGKEIAEEYIVKLGEFLQKGAVNLSNGREIFELDEYKIIKDGEFNERGAKEWLRTGLVAAPLAGISTSIAQRGVAKQELEAARYEAAKNITQARNILDDLVEGGKITQEQADENYKQIARYAAVQGVIPKDISNTKAVEIVPIIEENERLKIILENVDEAFAPSIKERIKSNIEKVQEILLKQEKDDGTTTDTSGIKTDEQGTVDGTIETPPSVGVVSETGVEGEGVPTQEVVPPPTEVGGDTPKIIEIKKKAVGTKVSDKSGEPIVVYHGSGRREGGSGIITAFDSEKISKSETDFPVNGFFFSARKSEALGYAGDEKNLGSYYVDIRNPASNKDLDLAVSEAVEMLKTMPKEEAEKYRGGDSSIGLYPSLVREILIKKGFDGYIPTPFGKPNLEKLLRGDGIKFSGKYFKYNKSTDEVSEYGSYDEYESGYPPDDVFDLDDFKSSYSEKGIFIAFSPSQIYSIDKAKQQEIPTPTVSQETVEVTQPTPQTGEGATPTVTPEVGVGETVEVEEKQDEAVEPQIQQAAQVAGVKAKNIRGLYDINRKMFGQDRLKSIASAIVMDRMIGAMAKRAGIPKTEMYSRIKFERATKDILPNNALMQGINSAIYELTVGGIDISEVLDVLSPSKLLLYNDFSKQAAELQKKYNKPTEEQDAAFVKTFRDNLLSTIDNAISFWESTYEKESVLNKSGDLSQVRIRLRNKYQQKIDKLKSSRDVIAGQLLSPQDIKMSKMGSILFQVDAWHGSPYQFDKFTTEKIGTGEGAQAFGWGLYFTDLESIARNYADILSNNVKKQKTIFIDGENLSELTEFRLRQLTGIDSIKNKEGLLSRLYKIRENSLQEYNQMPNETLKSKLKPYLDAINNDISLVENAKNIEVKEPSRNLYKVSLHKGKNPSQYTWLEWDKKPNKEQAQKLLSKLNKEQLDKGFYYGLAPDATNGTLYKNLSKALGGDKQASLFLLENGIDGIKYPAESIARGATSDTARGSNYVVFDENAVSIEEVIKFQRDAEKARGAAMVNMDGTAVIYALTDPNVTTPLHELAHVFEHYLSEAEKNTVIKSAKTKGWTTETSEYFARGFEKYLAEGKSPIKELQNLFDKFKQWLTGIYNGIIDSQIDVQLNRPMRKIYSQMLGKEIQPPKDLSPAERENLINIANKVGVNFREVQNVYNKYTPPSERKPLDQITEADYVKAQTARLTSPQDQANFKDTFISRLNALKEKFKSLEKGRKQGIMSTKALIAELQNLAKEYDKATGVDKATKSPRTERTLRNRRGGIRTFKDLDAYKRYVDKVVKDGNYADKVNKAKALANKVKALKDSKKITATDKTFIANLTYLDPKYVSDLDGYIDLLSKFEKSFKDTTAAWPTRKQDLQNFLEREGLYVSELLAAIEKSNIEAQKLDDIADAQAAIEEGLYEGTVGEYLSDLALARQTAEDLKNEEIELIKEARERIGKALLKKSERDEAAVKGLFKAMKAEIKQAFIDAGLAKDFNEIAQWASSTSSPTKTMSSEKSLLLSNILQNVFEDGDFTGLQTVTGEISAINKSDEIAALNPTFRRLEEKRKKGYTVRTALIALTPTVDILRKMQDALLGGWEGIVARGRKKHIEFMGQFKALTKEYGVDNLASQMKIDTYAFINQWFSDLSDAEADIAFQQRYMKRALDSKYIFNQTYKNADKAKRKIIQGEKARESINALYDMGLITKPQFKKNKNGSESVEFDVIPDKVRADIQNALSPNEAKMYDFVMRVFESMKPQVQRGATIGQNQQWRDIANYYPTMTDGMNLDSDEMANRLSYANAIFGFSKTSGNAKSRVEDISKINPENRIYRQGLHDMFSLGVWENIMIANASKERNYVASLLSDQSPMRKILGDREFKIVRDIFLSKYSKDLTHGWVRQDEPTLAFEYSRALSKAVASFILVRPEQILKQSTGIIASYVMYPKQTHMAMKLLFELYSDPRGNQLIENTSALGRDPIFLQDIHSAEFPTAYFDKGLKKKAVQLARGAEAVMEDIGDVIMPIAGAFNERIQDNSFFKFIDRMNTKVVAWSGFVDQVMRENKVSDYNDVRAIIIDQLNKGDLSAEGIQASEDFVSAINSESNQSNLPDELTKNRLLYFMKSFAYITSGHALENWRAYQQATTKEDKAYYLKGVGVYVIQAVAFAAISYMLTQVPKLWDDDDEELSEQELLKRKYDDIAGAASKIAGLVTDLVAARYNVFANVALSIATNIYWYLWSDAEAKEMAEQDPDFNKKMIAPTISIEPKAGGAFASFLDNIYKTSMEGGKELSLLKDAELPKTKSAPTFVPTMTMITGMGTIGEIFQKIDKKQDEDMRKIAILHSYGLKGKEIEKALKYLDGVKSENLKKHIFVMNVGDIFSEIYIVNNDIYKRKYGREYQEQMRGYADQITPMYYKKDKDKVADIRKKRNEFINKLKIQYVNDDGRLFFMVNKTNPNSNITISLEDYRGQEYDSGNKKSEE